MEGQTQSRDHALAQLATEQHGVVAYWQLIQLGFSKGAVERRVMGGRLHRVYRGVYAVGHRRLSRLGRLMAAALAYGPSAVVSHWSAAELWGFVLPRGHQIHVSAAADRRSRPGISFHRVSDLPGSERARRSGIPVTSVPRTLFDVAGVANTMQLGRVVEEAERAGWVNTKAIAAICEAHRGEPGVRAVRGAVAAVLPGTRRTRSELEARFLRMCRTRRIPLPIVNARAEGYEVDCLWPAARLIVELDGYEYHRSQAAFERDRRRDAELKRAGYEVIRVTYRWLTSDPDAVADTIRALLAKS